MVIPCADGKKRQIDDEDENSDFCMGDIDCVGFLVKKQKGSFPIDSAIHAGGGCPPPPAVDVAKCGPFDAPMEAYINKFIRP